MDPKTVADQLVAARASVERLRDRIAELCESWTAAGAGVETMEPILRFMEDNASLDLGAPGPLVQFVERLRAEPYENRLLESLARKPTEYTVWMLNRVINGTEEPVVRQRLVQAMERVQQHPLAEPAAAGLATGFLKRLRPGQPPRELR